MKGRNDQITEDDKSNLFPTLQTLLDAWCDRRALTPLRVLLNAYPLPNGLTDEWQQLHAALSDLENRHDDVITSHERQQVTYARRVVQFILGGR